ncbi:MAG: hypothetical protein GY899_16300 [Verrucomicrobiaceae bacterium]|nr:hypothetical protein [Verrucomicrobiaceae bacterium]
MRRIKLMALMLILGNASAEDIVHVKNGRALGGQILELNETRLRIRVPLAGGAGSSTRTIPMEQVRMIDFDPVEGELELLAGGEDAPRNELSKLWEDERVYLGLPNSNAGDIGMQLAGIFLATIDRENHVKARNLYELIEQQDWNAKRKALAKRGRLQALVKLGAGEEVIAEAKIIAADDDDPELLLDAKHVITLADFERFSKLVGDNPKWMEDDGVREQIEENYHALIDRFLEPFLFYGTEAVAASRGLWHAAKTYELVGQETRALECLSDLEKLYSHMGGEYPLAELREKLSIEK